ncbi:YdeI/OmpD-associated family protein [Mongoliitalea daihaiensis]|uniref:YdeI/OmpD-associated family protein n=1 Tax=Mongoliitalea daihaiensis TaxID=2782006 RepID=UPI001F44B568|nr:YdeI/OmpD-associated family protein [Mongoliitalea daihaiensis]UJP63284.1 YdeI/OmpD-associated family protein [Mongoliitalea daihaiensis]
MIQTENFEKIEVSSSQELRNWLSQHHQQEASVWLVTFKKSIPEKYLSTADVLDELLCFGWIDGIRRKLDDHRTMQLISPRRVEHWAKSYKDRAAKLIEDGKMTEAGLTSIELSKQAGLWNFMDDVDQLIIPEDLLQALRQLEGAETFFHSINDSSKRFVLRWLKLAKTEKTRQARIQQLVELSAKGEKLKGS